MRFNPTKCTVLRIAPTRSSKKVIDASYTLHGHTLETEGARKYLGVTITSNLSWNTHIENTAGKGNKTIGFIRRNLKDCTKPVREASYTSMVRPILEYSSTVWDPHTTANINLLEQVQRRAARYVCNDYTSRTPGCVTSMMDALEWESLHERRKKNRLCMLYKINNALVDIKKDDYLKTSDARTRGDHNFFQDRTYSENYRQSFFPRTIRDWNQLPIAITTASSYSSFRSSLDTPRLVGY